MSNFEILDSKISFLQVFYQQTTDPFREIERKIDANEEPYVAHGNPEDYDEPPFLTEWQEADEGLRLQGQVCLALLQRSFREFLKATVRQHRDYPNSRPKEKGNWFENYKTWFREEAAIDWGEAPISLNRIEELTIARNCIQHGGESQSGPGDVFDSHALLKMQSNDYHEKFPDAFFADEFEKQIWAESNYPQPVRIDLTPDKLGVAGDDIRTFCKFIDDNLPGWMY